MPLFAHRLACFFRGHREIDVGETISGNYLITAHYCVRCHRSQVAYPGALVKEFNDAYAAQRADWQDIYP